MSIQVFAAVPSIDLPKKQKHAFLKHTDAVCLQRN